MSSEVDGMVQVTTDVVAPCGELVVCEAGQVIVGGLSTTGVLELPHPNIAQAKAELKSKTVK